MNVEIIVIGDELLIGQVTDTNSGWIARELNHIGWEVTEITTVRDRSREITDALNSSFGRVDVVLMTGGLGPTKDDITKQTLCDYFGGKLVFDESVFANVEAIFRRRKLTMNDSTRNQAYVPNVCTVIQNPVGTAPVMWFERNGKVLVSMPGVPTEMKTVMKEVVISRLREYFQDHSSILHRTCLVKDFTESRLSETLSDFEAQLPACIKLAYLPTPGVIRLRLTARGDEESYLQKIIDDAEVSEAEKKSAVDAMVKLTENAQMEEDAQMMLEAKGFKNAVVSLSDECCDVIVGKDDVTDEKRAQIEDIIKRKTNIGASNIVISTMD